MLAIEQSACKAKSKLIYLLMREIEEQMQSLCAKYDLETETKFNWFVYAEQAETYYSQSSSSYPGINYIFKSISLPDDIELWLRIEIDYCLFAGLCLFDPNADSEYGRGNQLNKPNDEIISNLNAQISLNQYNTVNSWWVKWWYLPTGTDNYKVDTKLIPNFKEMNEAAVRLSNKDIRNDFAVNVVNVIDKELSKILN